MVKKHSSLLLSFFLTSMASALSLESLRELRPYLDELTLLKLDRKSRECPAKVYISTKEECVSVNVCGKLHLTYEGVCFGEADSFF